MSELGKKKVLIITYYWPPSGGSPVLRWLKFTKYLPSLGWEPVIYTPVNPVPQAYDSSLEDDIPKEIKVIRTKIKEPTNWFGLKDVRKKVQSTAFISEKGKPSIKTSIAIWIRGNFFIPDARMFWIRPSVRKLKKLIVSENIDALISTGPPHSMHLIACQLKKETGIPWIADFRDPWTNIDFYSELKLTRIANKIHHRLEKKVLDTADAVITVGPTMTKEFKAISSSRVYTITNGFDIPARRNPNQEFQKFSILHVGSMPASRNPKLLWKVLAELMAELPELKNYLSIEFIGKVDHSVIQEIEQHHLFPFLTCFDHMANSQAIVKMQQAALLLLVINNTQNSKGILTNKFFEYLSAFRPIVAIGPTDGDVAEIMQQTSAGKIADYNDEPELRKIVINYFSAFKAKALQVPDGGNIDRYSRQNLTKQLVQILSEITA